MTEDDRCTSHYLVTGASSGIGAAVVSRLLTSGSRVTGVARRNQSGTTRHLDWLNVDMADLDALSSLDGRLRKLAPLHGAVICHGYGDFDGLEQFSVERVRRLIDTNLTSVVLLCRVLLPLLKRHDSSTLILLGSESALRGGRFGAVYAASKFGLRGLAQSLREECSASGVRVSLVNPGMVDTPFFDQTWFRPGSSRDNALDPADVAKVICDSLAAPSHLVTDEINLSPVRKVVERSDRHSE